MTDPEQDAEDQHASQAFAGISSGYREFLEGLKPDVVIPQQPDGTYICCDQVHQTPSDLFQHRQHEHG